MQTTPIAPKRATTIAPATSTSSATVLALSGGWDSTALALRMLELGDPVDHYLITPTGDELPEMVAHWERLECVLGAQLTRVGAHTLDGLIEKFGALPNSRQRWCTRMLKIEPCLAWMKARGGGMTLCVGLRADEEERKGIFSNDVTTRFPLREWGWGRSNVVDYVRGRGIEVPTRTDCARCYDQRLGEWWRLWREHPVIYAAAEAQEASTGHTFRSATRDSWPASLAELRGEFERGRVPRGGLVQLTLFRGEDAQACRVCRL